MSANAINEQQKIIKGKVTDTSLQPLPGVTIINTTSKAGTSTDFNGEYNIKAKKGDILVFSYVGMEKQSITVEDSITINTSLKDSNTLEEVVVVGYGTQKKINITGSVVSVNVDKVIGDRPVANIATLIQGSLPGLTIGYGSSGGEPGSSNSLQIRGIGSINGGSAPYILVDGFPSSAGELNSLNPEDIEDISVLKDAAAAAIYGSKGAFGVILVSTKTGKKGMKAQATYSSSYQLATNTVTPNMANSVEFANSINDGFLNSNLQARFSAETIQKMQDYLDGKIENETELTANGKNWTAGKTGYANNRWFSRFYKDNVARTKHNLSIRGGEKKTTYFFSGSIFEQEGQLRYGDDTYDRINVNSTVKTEANNWLDFELAFKYSKETTLFGSGGLNGYSKNILYHQIARAHPTNPLFDPEGNVIDGGVLRATKSGNGKLDEYITNFSFAAILEPIKGWSTKIRYQKKTKSTYNNIARLENYLTLPGGDVRNFGYSNTSFTKSSGITEEELFNVVSTYKKSIKKHNFKAILGYEHRRNEYQSVGASNTDFIAPLTIPALRTALGDATAFDSFGQWTTQGVFSSVQYNYDEKYLLEFKARSDGSSIFSNGKRWGFFPSASIGYNIAKEDFFEPLTNIVNSLKIRASYGSLGNHTRDHAGYYQQLLPQGRGTWLVDGKRINIVGAPRIVSPTLTWETVSTANLGIDANLFNNKLITSFEVYDRRVSDLFGNSNPVPNVLGTNPPTVNNGVFSTKGFEFAINWQDKIGKVSYNVGFNVADSKSEIIKFNNDSGNIYQNRAGRVSGDIWGFETVGIFQTQEEVDTAPVQTRYSPRWRPGDIQYKDLNGDGKIDHGTNTEEDHGDLKIIGNSRARYNYGIRLGAKFKGIGLNIAMQGVAKRDVNFGSGTNLFWGHRGNLWQNSITKASLDYWSPENTSAYFPKPYMKREHTKNTKAQTRYLQNGAYLRVKNIQLSYTIPANIITKIGVTSLRFYISADNMLTFTSLNENFDPETTAGQLGQGKIYPPSKVLSTGIKLTF